MEINNPIKTDDKPQRDSLGRFVDGNMGGPGRNPGKTLKEWAKDRLMSMNEKERLDFLKGLPKDIIWRMAEGNPAQNNDITSGGKPLYFPSELINKNEPTSSTETNSDESEEV